MAWRVEDTTLLVGGSIELSFQRYPRPNGSIRRAPSSCGALPVAIVGSNEAIVPVDGAEALWVGMVVLEGSVGVLAKATCETDHGSLSARITYADSEEDSVGTTTAGWIEGIHEPGGRLWPIIRTRAGRIPAVAAINIEATFYPIRKNANEHYFRPTPQHDSSRIESPRSERADSAGSFKKRERIRIVLVGPVQFSEVAGVSWDPLNTEDRFGGWRLP